MTSVTIESSSEERSAALGEAIGGILEPGDVVALWGELGAGKTFLAGSIARGLRIPRTIPITSPTFTLINEYDGRLHLYHLDLYRLGDPSEVDTLPWREALYGTGVAVIEWPERLGDLIPPERWDIVIEILGDEARRFTIRAHGDRNEERLSGSWDALGPGGKAE
jgi:tRNA threonylcarbamoyladenosine biosynthesis protein TsaE